MIEILLLTRILVDYAWEYKSLNVIHTGFVLVAAAFYISRKLRTDAKLRKTDILVLLFAIYVVYSFITTRTDRGLYDFVKLMPCAAYYAIGRFYNRSPTMSILPGAAAATIAGLFLAAMLGVGYIDWGGIKTFTAGYFFKTDAALGVVVLTAFALLWSRNTLVIAALVLIGSSVVFATNARIAIPLVLVLPGLLYLSQRGLFSKSTKALAFTSALTVLAIGLFSFIDLGSLNLLGLDLSDPFSDKNTQGRTHIWAALINYYNTLDIYHKLTGAGLAADIVAASNFYQNDGFTESRAHNSFLWLLVCFGWLGGALYLSMLAGFVRQAHTMALENPKSKLLFLFAGLFVVFLVFSISTEAVVKPQITFPLFLFAGFCANPLFRKPAPAGS
ncbi:O-antigen ligase family protein [Stenotrophomonas sp. ATs4]|uniref:O-antigen ligase family protein n=1 Tax=Stenotrophomonas sp. ATs4 TaxID=3402766 RepID=UPI003F705F6D